MFKDKFIKYCNQIGESPTAVCMQIGLSSAAFSKWNDDSIPRKATLQKFADYFGITVEELLADEPAPSVRVNNGIIGNQNSNNVVSVGNAGHSDLGEIETEIVNICKKLDIKRKNALLTRAYELLEEDK
jgi:transcriptional regulator with XRE-family HTH domain